MRIDKEGNTYKYPCLCCNTPDMLDVEGLDTICRNCGWQDDPQQRDDLDFTGANGHLTLRQARQMISEGKKIKEGYPRKPYGEPAEEEKNHNCII